MQNGIGDGEGYAADEGTALLFDELDDGVLNDLGIHLETRDFRMLAHGAQDCVGNVADAWLNGQEFLRNVAIADFRGEKLGDVLADASGDVGDGAEVLDLVRAIGVDDADDLFGVDPDALGADAVLGVADGDGAAMGRRLRFVDIVET